MKCSTKVLGAANFRYAPLFSQDSRLFFLNSGNSIRVYNSKSAEELAVLQGHEAEIIGLVTNKRNPFQLISASLDGTIRIWDLLETKCIRVLNLEHGESITFIARSHNTSNFVFLCESKSKIANLSDIFSPEYQMNFSNKDGSFVSNSNNSLFIISKDLSTGKEERLFSIPACQDLKVSNDGQHIAALSDCSLYLWNTKLKGLTILQNNFCLTRVSFHPKNHILATADIAGRITL